MKFNFSFAIKTFNRPEHLINLVKSIRKYYNNPIYIVDDGNFSAPLDKISGANIFYKKIPFDSGVSVGRNTLVDMVKEKYFILMDDDWEVTDRTNLHMMYRCIKKLDLDILGGNFISFKGQNLYHGKLRRDRGILYLDKKWDWLEFKDLDFNKTYKVKKLDVVNNFFMGKTESIKRVLWTPEYKIGGEHIDFFYRALKLKLSIGYIEDCIMLDAVKKIPVPKNYKKNYSKYRSRGQKHLNMFLKKNNLSKLDLWFKNE